MSVKLWDRLRKLTITDRLSFAKGAQMTVRHSDGVDYDIDLNELRNILDPTSRVINLAATSLTLTAALHGERIVTLSHTGAASTVTLPAATGSGNRYLFIVAAVNTNNHKIQVANATDVFEGLAYIAQDGGDAMVAFESAATSDTITLNGTTTGGAAIGDRIEIIDYASGKFHILAHLTGTGTEATPFSAAVS